jgi:hypothetical protein
MQNHPDRILFRVFIAGWVVMYGLALVLAVADTWIYFSVSFQQQGYPVGAILLISIPILMALALAYSIWKLISIFRSEDYWRLARYLMIPVVLFLLIIVTFVIGPLLVMTPWRQ